MQAHPWLPILTKGRPLLTTRIGTTTRSLAIILLALLFMASTAVLEPDHAEANSGGYPYATYHGPGTNPSTYTWTDSSGNEWSPYGYAYRNCTDYVAWKLQSLGVPDSSTRGLGNGGQWAALAGGKEGLTVSTTPTYAAAAVNTSTAGGYGHVSFVESVHSNGTITVSEYNYASPGNYGTRTGTPSALGISEFVHFGVDAGGQNPEPVDIPRSDFSGNGTSDILWYGPGAGRDTMWFGSGQRGFVTGVDIEVNGDYLPVLGDFDGDSHADVLWYGPGGDHDSLWYGTATKGVFETRSVNVSGHYTPIVADFNGNGQDDILWYGPGSDRDTMWFGSGSRSTKFATGFDVNVNGTYTPLAGDFDADGHGDVLWYGPGTDHDALWFGTGTKGTFSTQAISVNGTYQPFSGNFDGAAGDDVFWYGPGSDRDTIWLGQGNRTFTTGIDASVHGTYEPIPGDFDGDGAFDVLWYGPGGDHDSLWYGTNAPGVFETHSISVSGTYTAVV
ncbi:CHAP domain-containing protein [Nocardiopsis sp. CNR-923]|uniref:CHAP domain-containing protein n=1 Tax=Nocardiopsis sp. CNR-923 TaxID=1904965 RepID=UPI00117CD7C9|nr:CHAP domain-containing protein [Nocardiopsis sp. CNR-923]